MAKASYDVPAVRKAIRLLEVLCDTPRAMGVTELAQQLEMNKNMVFRLLRTLCEEGWVVQEDGPGVSDQPFAIPPHQQTGRPDGYRRRGGTLD